MYRKPFLKDRIKEINVAFAGDYVNSVRNGKLCRAAMLANHVIEESFLSMIIILVGSKVGLAEYMAQYGG